MKEASPELVSDVCNAFVKDGKIPEDGSKSWLASVYKGKGDALECGSYRGIKILEHVLKIFELMRCVWRGGKNRQHAV